jgi:hypothetical protein
MILFLRKPRTCDWVVTFGLSDKELFGSYLVNARDKRAATVKAWRIHRGVAVDGLLPGSRVKVDVRKADWEG